MNLLFKKNWGLLIVILVSLLPLFALFHSGLPLTHDGQDHVARIANFYQNLVEGVIIPRWAGNLNWGYGHPILMFLYPLSSYTASFFHFLGLSFVDSTKLVFGLAFVLSGITMYVWLREFLDDSSAVVGTLLYNFAPYRFVDLYVRGAIGEHVAFIFPPLILYFFLKIAKSKTFNKFYFSFASLSIAGLVLAHNAISIMFLPFIIFYGIYLIVFSSNRKSLIYQFASSLILGFALSAFFVLPAYVEGKYTLRDIVTAGEALKRFVSLNNLIYSPWNYGQSGDFSVQVGILPWIAVIAGLISLWFYKKKKEIRALIIVTIIYFLASLFIMLPASEPLWKIVTTLQKFQFPWRFLSISVFSAAVLGAIAFNLLSKKSKAILVFLVVVLTIGLTVTFWHPKAYLYKPEAFYSGVYFGTTDTGESAPIWSVRFMEHTASTSSEVIAGSAKITPVGRSSTKHVYEITAPFRSRIRENTLYFPGWKIYIDGNEYEGIQFQDPANRGLMTYYVPSGKHNVVVQFSDTKIRTIANLVSLGALIIIVGILVVPIGKKRKV